MSTRFRNGHRLPAALLALLVAASATLVWSSMSRSQPRRAPTAPEARPDEQKLQKFSLTGFDDKGKKFWNLEGETAKIDSAQTVFLEENVMLRLKGDTLIRTERVQWSQDRGTLNTDALVNVYHHGAKVTGTGAVGRPSESFVQLNRDIDMQLDATTRVTCKGPLKLFYKENRMALYRDVRVVDQRGALTARRMDVYFGEDNRQVEKIVAIGDVVIERGTDTTRSRRAIYTPSTGSLRLEGNPQITLKEGGTGLLHAAPAN